jgi:hypothetical protein
MNRSSCCIAVAKNFKSQAGAGLIEIMISVSIVAGLGLVGTYALIWNKRVESSQQSEFWIEQQRNEVKRLLNDNDHFDNLIYGTAADGVTFLNPSLACIRDRTQCATPSTTPTAPPPANYPVPFTLLPLKIFEGSGRVVIPVSATDPRISKITFATSVSANSTLSDGYELDPGYAGPISGFKSDGTRCVGFVPPIAGASANGNDACPFKVVTRWDALCRAQCENPEIKLTFSVLHNPSSESPAKNMSRFSFRAYRSARTESIASSCAANHGTMSGNICLIDATGACAAGTAVVGFNVDNSVKCQSLSVSYSCPAGEFFRGVDPSDGSAVCGQCP